MGFSSASYVIFIQSIWDASIWRPMALQALQIISCGLEVSQDCFSALSIDVIRSQIAFFYNLLKGIIGKVLQGKYAAFCQLQLFFLRVAEWFRGLLRQLPATEVASLRESFDTS
ncbi:hypothetical protein, partial [uncultured Mitsuokella sp.]|uniref:hypothetical protein n=1 Tax=uncultured Mitsuokella sp. TaxID=453120 RepID=UPI00266BCEEE